MSQEDTAVNTEVVEQETTVTESAPVETNTPEGNDDLLQVLSDDEEPSTEAETDSKPVKEESKDDEPSDKPAEETPAEEAPEGEKLAPKSENRFQKLANENKELRSYIEQLNNQVYQPETVEDLVDQGLSQEMAEVRQLKQQLELNDYNNRVVEAQASLNQQAEQVITSLPIFNPDSPEYDAQIASQAAEALQASLITDPNTGQIIGSHLSPYQIYKPIADAYEKAKTQGQIKGQKATEKMLSNVDSPSSASPRESKKDPLLEILKSDD